MPRLGGGCDLTWLLLHLRDAKLMAVKRKWELPSDEYSNLPPFDWIGGVTFFLLFVLAMNIALIVLVPQAKREERKTRERIAVFILKLEMS